MLYTEIMAVHSKSQYKRTYTVWTEYRIFVINLAVYFAIITFSRAN